MRSFKSFSTDVRRVCNRKFRELNRSTRALRKKITSIAFFPLRMPFLALKSLGGVFHDTGVVLDREKRTLSPAQKLGQTFKSLVLLPFRLITAPIRTFRNAQSASQRLDLLFVLPPLMAILFFGYVVSYVFAKTDAIKSRYRN